MREKLIELIREPLHIMRGNTSVGETQLSVYEAEAIADRILADGWKRLPEVVIVGDMLYQSDKHIADIDIDNINNKINDYEDKDKKKIGKTVFFSREEAEKALEGVE